jgi:hypothetical protein
VNNFNATKDNMTAAKPYEDWKKNWQPPVPRPMAMPGKVMVEFAPHAHHGEIWTPEKESNNAMVVSDGNELKPSRDGYIPAGTEVCYTGKTGTYFEHGGRRLCVIPKQDIEMVLEWGTPSAKAV